MEAKLEGLIQYAGQLERAGLDTKQNYYRFSKVCDEIEKELGIKQEAVET